MSFGYVFLKSSKERSLQEVMHEADDMMYREKDAYKREFEGRKLRFKP